MLMPLLQQYPYNLCLIKYELDINVYYFKNFLVSILVPKVVYTCRRTFMNYPN